MAKPTKEQAGAAADEFFALKAAQAELAEKEKKLKSVLLAYGKPEIEGKVARVTISTVPGRVSVDIESLKKVVPAKVLAALMKTGAASKRFACKARVADASVAA